jgi:hypothetical protein
MILECKLRSKNNIDTYKGQIYKYLLNKTAGQYGFFNNHIIPLKSHIITATVIIWTFIFSNITPF